MRHSKKAFANDDYHEAYFKTAVHGVAHIDVDGRFLDVNEAFCHLVGYTRSELLNMEFRDITDCVDLRADISSSNALIKGDLSSYSIDKSWVHKTGRLARANVQMRRVPFDGDFDFEHFVCQAYKLAPLANVKLAEGGVRTTTSWQDFLSDNKKAMMWFFVLVSFMGFISGNLPEIMEFILKIWAK